MTKLKVYLSDTLNPHMNLAIQEWIFNKLDSSQQALFLWRNEDTVVIGRHQNPWSECNLLRMKAEKVHLARRTSGGGAVFHDLGNTNFNFLSPKESFNSGNNNQIILNSLAKLGIKAEISGFSCSAYREKKDRAFHHGTLLLHTNLVRLRSYLTSRARLANLSEIAKDVRHDKMVEAMIGSFAKFYDCTPEIECLTEASLQQIPEIKAQYEDLSAWEWLYGDTLEFNHAMYGTLSLGSFDIQLEVQDELVKDLRIYTNCIYPLLVDEITEALREVLFSRKAVFQAFDPIISTHLDLKEGLLELRDWICKNIVF